MALRNFILLFRVWLRLEYRAAKNSTTTDKQRDGSTTYDFNAGEYTEHHRLLRAGFAAPCCGSTSTAYAYAAAHASPAQQQHNDNGEDQGKAFPEEHRIALHQRWPGLVEEFLVRLTQLEDELG